MTAAICLGQVGTAQEGREQAGADAAGQGTGGGQEESEGKSKEGNIRFQFDGIPYMDVVERFAQMAGKPLVTDTRPEGSLTFNDERPYSYEEALSTLNVILSMKDVALVETERFLRLVPLKQLPQMQLKILRNIEEPGDVSAGEVVTVVLHLEHLNVKDVSQAATSMLSNAGSLAPLTEGRGLIITDRLGNIQRIQQLLHELDTESPVDRQMKSYTLLHASGAVVADLINKTFGQATAAKRTVYNEGKKSYEVLPADPTDYVTAIYDEASRTLIMFGPTDRIALAEDLIHRFEDADGARAGEVKIYFPRMNAEELAKMIRQAVPGIAKPEESGAEAATKARLIVDASLNRLIVAAPIAGQLDSIEKLVQRIDQQASPDQATPTEGRIVRVTEIFPVEQANATALSRMITEALSDRTASNQLLSRVTVTVDEATGSLAVTGSPADVAHAGRIVEQVEEQPGRDVERETRFIVLSEGETAADLARLAEQLYQAEYGQTKNGADAQVTPDWAGRRLIVTARPEHAARIEQLVEQIRDGVPERSGRETRLLAVPREREGREFIQLVEDLYGDQQATGNASANPASFRLSQDGRQMIMTGRPEDLERVERIVEQLEAGAVKVEPRELKVIKLEHVEVSQALPVIQELVQQRLKDAGLGQQPEPYLLPDGKNNRLLMTGTESQLAEIDPVVRAVDVAPVKPVVKLSVVALKSLSHQELIPLLQPMLDQMERSDLSGAGPAPKLLRGKTPQELLVLAAEEDLEEIRQIIRQLDGDPSHDAARSLEPVLLSQALATELLPLVQQLYQEQLKGQPEPAGGPASILADGKDNRLMVSGPAPEIDRVRRIVRQLDPEEARKEAAETRVIRLQSGKASDLAQLVENSLAATRQSARVLVDERSNSLIVSGSQSAVAAAAEIISQLDARPMQSPAEVRIINLRAAKASELAPMVEELFAEIVRDQKGPEEKPVARLIPDDRGGRLILSGPRDELNALGLLVEQLDDVPEQAGGTRVFKLREADAEQLAKVVSEAMMEYDERNRPQHRVTVSADRESNSLVVSGARDDLQDVALVIEQLDGTRGLSGQRSFRIVEVEHARAGELAALAKEIFEGQGRRGEESISIRTEPSGRRLILLAPEEQIEQVEQVVRSLDEPSKEAVRKLEVIEVEEAVDRILPSLNRLYSEQSRGDRREPASIVADSSGNRLAVLGAADQIEQVRAIVQALQGSRSGEARPTQMFQFDSREQLQQIKPLVEQLYQTGLRSELGERADAVFLTDEPGRRLIVAGPEAHLERIGRLVNDLKQGAQVEEAGRETRVFEAGNGREVQRLVPLVQKLYQDQWRSKAGEDEADAQILGDDVTGRILVTGRPEHLQAIMQILEQLSAGGKVEPLRHETRVYELRSASANGLAETVRTLYQKQRTATGGSQGEEALILADENSNRLIVSGEGDEVRAVEGLVEQLDQVSAQTAGTRVFKLKSNEAEQVAGILSSALVEVDRYGRSRPRVSVGADPKSNTVIVSGEPADLQSASVIIEQLDSAGTGRPREMKLIPIEQGVASEMAEKVRQLFLEQMKGQPQAGPADAFILGDAQGNRLIVTGTAEQVGVIEDIVGQLERVDAAAAASLRTHPLQHQPAGSVIQVLQRLFAREMASGNRNERLVVTATPDNQGLLVEASEQLNERVEEVVAQLDRPSLGDTPRQTEIFELGNASEVERVQPLVEQLYRDQLRGNPGAGPLDAQFLTDSRGGRLIVTGRRDHLERIGQMIEQVQSGSREARQQETRVYELQSATAEELASTLETLYREQSRNRSGAVSGETLILPDRATNRLIVSGVVEELKVIEALVEKLDSVSAQTATTRVFRLKSSEAEQVATLLSRALVEVDRYGRTRPRVSVGADSKSNTVIVSGEAADLQSAAMVIEQLDAVEESRPRDLLVFPLQQNSAGELAEKVRQLYLEQMKGRSGEESASALILADETSNRLLVTATEGQAAVIGEIVQRLESESTGSRRILTLPLEHQDADVVLPVLQGLFARELAGADRNQRLSLSAAPGNRAVLLEGSASVVKRVQELVATLDKPGFKGAPRQTAVLEVGNPVEAQRLLPILQQLYEDQVQGMPAAGPADAQLLLDEANGHLIASGRESHLRLIRSLLGEVQAGDGTALPRTTRIYELKTAVAEELASTVERLFEEELRAQKKGETSRVLVLPDRTTNRLVVSGPEEQVAYVDEIVQKLDEASSQTANTRVFKLKVAEAEQVASILSNALVHLDRRGRSEPRVSVGADAKNNILIVSGERDDLQAAGVIIEQLDAMTEREERLMRIVPIQSGLASEVAARVEDLYRDRLKGLPDGGAADALVMGDDSSNRLIFAASVPHMKILEGIVGELEEGGSGAARQIRVLFLQKNSASSVASMLSQLFNEQIRANDPNQRLVITASPDDRTLLVDANSRTHEQIEQLVSVLDEDGLGGQMEVRSYRVEQAGARALASSLTRLFSQRTRRGTSEFEARFEGDDTANLLMVAATADQFEAIEKLIQEVQKEVEVASEIRTFRLEHARAEEVVPVLQSMVGADLSDPYQRYRYMYRRSRGSDEEPLKVTAAPALNAVVVQGSPSKVELAEQLLEALDKPEAVEGTSIHTVFLKKADAETVADAVNETLRSRLERGRTPRVTVTAVASSNSLLINGPQKDVDLVLDLVRELDEESVSEEIKVRIFKLEHGKALELSRTLGQFLQSIQQRFSRGRGQRGGRASVTADERTNTLIVSGTEQDFHLIEQLLPTLDQAPERSNKEVHFVWLENANALDVALQVEGMFLGRPQEEQPVVEADPFSNSITVIAKREDLLDITSVIERLDESARDNSLQVRMVPFDRVPAQQMAEMLESLYSQMSGSRVRLVEQMPKLNLKSRKGSAEQGEESDAREAEEELEREPDAAGTDRSATEAGEEPALEEILISVDEKSNALIMAGPAYELDAIDDLIFDLTFSFLSGDAEFRRFQLKEADPVAVAKTLNELFQPDQARQQQQQKQQQQQQQGEEKKDDKVVLPPPKVTVVAEPRTRSIIVRAEPKDIALMESLIEELDAAGIDAQVQFELVPLENALPEKVLPLVQQAVTELTRVRPAEPIAILTAPSYRALFVVARQGVLEQLAELIDDLDRAGSQPEVQLRVVPLTRANASQVGNILRNILRPASEGELTDEARELQEQVRRLQILDERGNSVILDLGQPIKILSDPLAGGQGGNQLILISTGGNLRALEEVIAMMDRVPLVEGVSVRMVQMENADAALVAQTLENIFQQGQQLSQGPGGAVQPDGLPGKALVSPLNVAVDERSNTIILSGIAESLTLAQTLIEEMDRGLQPGITEVKLYRLKYASAEQMAPLLQAVFSEGNPVPGSEGAADQVTRLRTVLEAGVATAERAKARDALVIQPDLGINALLVAARSDTIPLIEDLIDTMDIPEAAGMESIRIYPLQHATAATVQRVLVQLYSNNRSGRLTAADRPQVAVDARTNVLIVAGKEGALAVVERLIESLDQPQQDPAVSLTVIPLEHNDSSRVASLIQGLFAARLQAMTPPGEPVSPQDQVQVEADPITNALVISASRDNLALIEGLIEKVDVEPIAAGGVIEVFSLEHVEAQRAGATLRDLVDQGLYRPGMSTARTGPGRAREGIAVSVDPRTNTLIVSASPENLAVVRKLISQLDQPGLSQEQQIKLYPLKNAKASHLALVLEQFFRAKRTSESVTGEGQPVRPVTVTPDDRTNTLLVTGGKESFAAIERMIDQLDSADIVEKTTFRVFSLQRATAAKVRDTLQQLFANRPSRIRGQPADPITIVADSWENSLIVGAGPEDMGMVESLVRRLDQRETETAVEAEILPVEKADAGQVAETIRSLYREGSTTSSAPVTVTVDERINALVISAGQGDVERIRGLVKKLDSASVARVSEIRVFPLRHAQAEELSEILMSILTENPDPLTAESPNRQSVLQFITRTEDGKELVASALKEGLLISPDRRTNSLIVSGPVDYMDLLNQIISRLDASSPEIAQIRVFNLLNADARQMAEVLTSLFRLQQATTAGAAQRSVQYTLVKPSEDPGKEAVSATLGTVEQYALTVTVDLRTNTLLIGGTEHYVALASEIIEELDSTPAQERLSQVYRLRNAQATEVEQALSSFLQQDQQQIEDALGQEALGTAQRVLDREVAIVAEPVSNSLLLSASPRYFDRIRMLIEELDQPMPQVLIQVLLAEVTLDSQNDLGVEWALSRTDGDVTYGVGTDFGVKDQLARFGGFSAAVTGSDYNFILRALQSEGRLEVLSRPQILTADNQEANINIGQRVPFITTTRITDEGTSLNTVEYEDVGVQLTVTPRISPDGFVKMDVGPTISALSSSSVNISPGVAVPIINERSATTTVTVQSGQSVIIGGLISTTDDVRTKQVPILGSIPYLGNLFRSKQAFTDRKELLIILTPQVLVKLDTEGRVISARDMTERQLERSNVRQQLERDELQQQVLEPLFPGTNRPPVMQPPSAGPTLVPPPGEPSPEL